tara:strand:- start:139 stop:441 length:303 start_codon:yes stop_codon:yes gene_type:complete
MWVVKVKATLVSWVILHAVPFHGLGHRSCFFESPLSGVFSIEKASTNRQGLQQAQAVDRIVAIIQTDPHKERIDKIITRWLKRHLQRLGAEVDLNQLKYQ